MAKDVLVIEDEPGLRNLVGPHLAAIDCRVKLAFDGETGLAAARVKTYDLVILDLVSGGKNGLEICRRLRSHADYPPILILSSHRSEMERILALEMGADDYVTKPFSVLELIARVNAIFRRVNAVRSAFAEPKSVLKVAGMTIDADKRSVTLNNRSVDLTAKEFELLHHLARNPGRVYTREQLLDHVWGYDHAGYEHTVNSHVNRLRGKIERDPTNPIYVRTVWGVGYKFSDQLAA